jgi:hypothetical protein
MSTHTSQSPGPNTQTTYIPSNPMVHFRNTSPVISPLDHQTFSSLHGGLSHSVPQEYSTNLHDTPVNTTIDIETQSIGNLMDVGSHQGQSYVQDHITPPILNTHRAFHAGCQTDLDPPSLEVKEQKKLILPTFDPQKMTWQNFSMKMHAALINQNMEYLLMESSTNGLNYAHSKELMLELYKKLQGSALDLFSLLNAQHYYLAGGRGIEMIKALVDKYHPLDNGAIQSIMATMQNLQLHDSDDLSKYKDKLENLNLQLSWVGQGIPESYLIHRAQTQLKTSRYGKDIEALQISNTASGTSFNSLHEFFMGLECLDCIRGLPYGGAAISKASSKPLKNLPPIWVWLHLFKRGLNFHSRRWNSILNPGLVLSIWMKTT